MKQFQNCIKADLVIKIALFKDAKYQRNLENLILFKTMIVMSYS